VQRARLVPGDIGAGAHFGSSVAIDGDVVLAGALDRDGGRGGAYVFRRNGDAWSQEARLLGDGGFDEFGATVALRGDTVVACANFESGARGAAYVFRKGPESWTREAKLAAQDSAVGDFFGDSVAMDGDTAVVGADNKDSSRGAAYVFVRVGAAWSQQAKFVGPDLVAGDQFGIAVALSGETALVGEYGAGGGVGSVFVYVRDGETWKQQAQLFGDSTDVAGFGAAVALDADTAVVGDFGNGAAYVFVRDGAQWTRQDKLLASDSAPADFFGTSVAVFGDVALVGADYHAGAKGAVYVFTRQGALWTRSQTIVAADAELLDHLGLSLALSGGAAVVGAYGADGGRGATYVFDGIAAAPSDAALVSFATPTRLSDGATISVLGRGFGSKPRAWLDVAGRKIRLRIARGAADTQFTARLASLPRFAAGPCTLAVRPRGTATLLTFPGMSLELPVLRAFDPPSARVRESVTISGSFFGARKGRVRMNHRKCRVRSWSDTSITVVVPSVAAGAVDLELDNRIGAIIEPDAFLVTK
jgi:hypothetical protein